MLSRIVNADAFAFRASPGGFQFRSFIGTYFCCVIDAESRSLSCLYAGRRQLRISAQLYRFPFSHSSYGILGMVMNASRVRT